MTEQKQTRDGVSRRGVLKGGAAAFGVMAASRALGAEANGKIRIGLIGCGGRGSWIIDLFNGHGGYEVVACADYFQDRADGVGDKFNLPKNRRFTTLSCHKGLLELDDVDAVAIISPPCFHPEQATAAIEAGKHVYLAKPVAVDAPGVRTIAKAAEKAQDKKLGFLIDFQTRANEFYIETLKRVHDGALGATAFGEARYHANRLGVKEPNDGSPESRLRNWVFDIALSGDILVEQNIHALDVMSWMMNTPPQYVLGTCGRKARVDVGNCNDHFAMLYQYPDGVGFTFSSKQYDDGGNNAGIAVDLYGSEGRAMTKYGGNVMIYGKNFYRGGETGAIYKEGAQNNIAAFHEQLTSGKLDYSTVPESVRSHYVALMGRAAAYEKRIVTWDEALQGPAMELDLNGLKA